MVLYPDIQKKAQNELDSVVGQDRLPHFGDRPYLPYLEAVVKEVFRWIPVAPTGLIHWSFHSLRLTMLMFYISTSSCDHGG